MVLDHDAPENLEETEAIEFMDDYLSWVFYEARPLQGQGQRKVQGQVRERLQRARALDTERSRKTGTACATSRA